MRDRRSTERRLMIARGEVLAGGLAGRVPCAVLDLSGRGARVYLLRAAELPEAVALRLPGGGGLRPAVRRWRRGAEAGFEFAR